MNYTQKDVCRACDIGRDTLRHYERLGIIEPEVAANGYRYYDDWQINLLWDCKRYQAMGFSLAQIRDMLHHDSLAGVQNLIDKRMEEMERELAYRRMAVDSMRLYRTMLKGAAERQGTYVLRSLPETRFVPRREVHDLLLDERLEDSGRFVNENQAVCLPPCAYFPQANDERYYWGFAMFTNYYRTLDGPEEGYVTLPSGPALTTCIDAGERWSFGRALFTGLLEEAERRGTRPRGMFFGMLLTRTYDEAGGYHRYVEAALPLEA